jgi:hypothetical protein
VVNVSGHDDVSVADVTTTLDRSLGTDGACVGAAVNGCSGPGTDHQRRSENGQDGDLTINNRDLIGFYGDIIWYSGIYIYIYILI